MRRVSLAVLAAAIAASFAPGPSLAQGGWDRGGHGGDHRPGGWDLDRRMEWIQQRIDAGRADGSLRRDESRRLQNRLDEIRQMVRRARHRGGGGVISPRDRQVLIQRLDDLSERVRRLRHNDERRPW
jgi:hypothetical protein